MTGREMVFYLLESSHLGRVVSFYLNYANENDYRPYDLITVPKSKANAEHFIFSVFGVPHRTSSSGDDEDGGGGGAEQLTLDEWMRFAMLWEACSRIRFFRTFLRRKFLLRWRARCKYARYVKLRAHLSTRIVSAVDEYGRALLHVSSLVQQVDASIHFLLDDEHVFPVAVTTLNNASAYTDDTDAGSSTNDNDRSTGNVSELAFVAVARSARVLTSMTKSDANLSLRAQFLKQQAANKSPVSYTHTLASFTRLCGDLRSKSMRMLDFFFVFVKYVLSHTRIGLFDKMRFYQKLVVQQEAL